MTEPSLDTIQKCRECGRENSAHAKNCWLCYSQDLHPARKRQVGVGEFAITVFLWVLAVVMAIALLLMALILALRATCTMGSSLR
jgi:ribosomal protein L40E